MIANRRIEPNFLRALAVTAALVAAVFFLPVGHAGSPPSPSTTTVGSCTEVALKTTVSHGGAVVFGLACSDLKFTTAITIGAGATVSISSGGFSVALDGKSKTRFFIDNGGNLTIIGITLHFGMVTRASGNSGGAGVPGLAGFAGPSGCDGGTDTNGSNAFNGTNGTAGHAAGKGGGGGRGERPCDLGRDGYGRPDE